MIRVDKRTHVISVGIREVEVGRLAEVRPNMGVNRREPVVEIR